MGTTFGGIIKSRRNQMGLTLAQLGFELGITGEFLSQVESGKRALNLDRVPGLARILDLDAAGLCRVALATQYPVIYSVLFPTQPPESISTVERSDTTREVQDLLSSLSEPLRNAFLNTIREVYTATLRVSVAETFQGQMRNAAKPIPGPQDDGEDVPF